MSDASPAGRRRSARWKIQASVFTAVWISALFVCAGRVNWIRGWVYVAAYAVGMSAIGLIVRHFNAGLLEERARWRRKDTERFDKAFLAAYIPLTYIQPAVAALDAVRFGWSSMPFGFMYAGVVLFVLAIALMAWAMAVNRFAESSVRIQTDRGQTVVASGPYRVVRHPMYVGATLMHLGTPLILGSLWALALAGLIIALFIWRTALEDQTLRRKLPGYEEYAARTRYRLLPGLW